MAIGLVNFWNRINVSTRQVPGDWSLAIEAMPADDANPLGRGGGDRRRRGA
jgi:hypothetical protein